VSEDKKFTIWIDNDGCPRNVRDVVFSAASRTKIPTFVVANTFFKVPDPSFMKAIVVHGDFNAADNYIADNCLAGDLVITADIPLADRVVAKSAIALGHRGTIYTKENIREILAMRNLREELRSAGTISGGPPTMNVFDLKAFCDVFDRTLTRMKRGLPIKA
jgi:uncharacterized protein YaiI (UPF0178 family)